MSFRDIRNLVEQLQSLGFPRLVSLANFNTPNLPLVLEVLVWAVAVVDADHPLPHTTHTPHDRVDLLRRTAIFFYQRLGVQLNCLQLYGGDRLAAQQLLKITRILHKASTVALTPSLQHQAEERDTPIHLSLQDIRETRQLASSIILDAANLTDRLALEVNNKAGRIRVERHGLNIAEGEAALIATIRSVADSLTQLQVDTQRLHSNVEEVGEKMKKKGELLARHKKRLDALQKIKPSWQSEFETDESELRGLWETYLTRHRTLAYLEDQLDSIHTQQLEAVRKVVEKREKAEEKVTHHHHHQVQEMVRRLGGLSVESSGEQEWSDSVQEDSDGSLTLDSLSPTSPTPTLGHPPLTPASYPPLTPATMTTGRLCRAAITPCTPGPSQPHHFTLAHPDTNKDNSILAHSAPAHPFASRPLAARPHSDQARRRRRNSVSVKTNERVSPLSASDDDLSNHF